MEILDSIWFTECTSTRPVGIVLVKLDNGDIKAYIGTADGVSKTADIAQIIKDGALMSGSFVGQMDKWRDHFGWVNVVAAISPCGNYAMAEKLRRGEALDVEQEGEFVGNGMYLLKRFVDDVDYCCARTSTWIWSIGKDKFTGEIYAAVDARFYKDDSYECLFLR